MKTSITLLFFICCIYSNAQVKIGNNPATINANSLLELESTNKGFLPPRVVLNSLSSVSPLTGTVPSGMLIFSSGGSVTDGYYYWNGAEWVSLGAGQNNVVLKTANATLTKTETFVLASNDIMITLPAITSADDGLSITIKNAGTHTDLVVVLGNGSSVIDESNNIPLPRWYSTTLTAKNGNWFVKQRTATSTNIMQVSWHSSWQTLQEAMEFLNLHMWSPAVIELGSGSFDIDETVVIDLPYQLTIKGTSFGSTTLSAASGLAGKPMFRCISDCNFKMLEFDATSLSGYGTAEGEDALRFVGSDTYNEIKDCSFDRFYNAILDSTNAELWVFENDIMNAQDCGILVHGAVDSAIVKVAETDFIGCKKGFCLNKGKYATIHVSGAGFYNTSSTDSAICYKPSDFTSFVNIHLNGNSWNNVGKYIEGFDFSRPDGRDANAFIQNNAGMGDQSPSCKINVNNNVSTTTVATGGVWYKAVWTNTSFHTTKWTIGDNRITYQPVNKSGAFIIITGNIAINAANKTVSIGIIKNGVTTTRIGETDLRLTTGNQPYQFSTVVYLENIGPGDYFELYCTSSSSNDIITFQDIQWFTQAK